MVSEQAPDPHHHRPAFATGAMHTQWHPKLALAAEELPSRTQLTRGNVPGLLYHREIETRRPGTSARVRSKHIHIRHAGWKDLNPVLVSAPPFYDCAALSICPLPASERVVRTVDPPASPRASHLAARRRRSSASGAAPCRSVDLEEARGASACWRRPWVHQQKSRVARAHRQPRWPRRPLPWSTVRAVRPPAMPCCAATAVSLSLHIHSPRVSSATFPTAQKMSSPQSPATKKHTSLAVSLSRSPWLYIYTYIISLCVYMYIYTGIYV